MKFSPRDLHKLQWHLLAALVSIGIAATIVWSAQQSQRHAENSLRQAENQHKQIAARLQQVRNEEVEIRDRASLFAQLTKAGVIGTEQRLDWTELLSSQQRQLRLPALNYEFAPQTMIENSKNGQYAFYRSPMKLHLHVVHEEDLLRFINGLERHASALVLTRSCKLARLTPNASERDGTLAQLTADCELDWITARTNGGQ